MAGAGLDTLLISSQQAGADDLDLPRAAVGCFYERIESADA